MNKDEVVRSIVEGSAIELAMKIRKIQDKLIEQYLELDIIQEKEVLKYFGVLGDIQIKLWNFAEYNPIGPKK